VTKYAEGTKHCEGCGILFWEKDLRKGKCIDCIIKEHKQQIKELEERVEQLEKQPALF